MEINNVGGPRLFASAPPTTPHPRRSGGYRALRRRTRTLRVACLGATAPLPSEQKAGGLRPFAPHLTRHPIHGALKWKPSGIPVAVVVRPRCGGQFRLSFFRRRAGPRRSGEMRSQPQATSFENTDAAIAEGNNRGGNVDINTFLFSKHIGNYTSLLRANRMNNPVRYMKPSTSFFAGRGFCLPSGPACLAKSFAYSTYSFNIRLYGSDSFSLETRASRLADRSRSFSQTILARASRASCMSVRTSARRAGFLIECRKWSSPLLSKIASR